MIRKFELTDRNIQRAIAKVRQFGYIVESEDNENNAQNNNNNNGDNNNDDIKSNREKFKDLINSLRDDEDLDALVQHLNNLRPEQLKLLKLGFGHNKFAKDIQTKKEFIQCINLHPTQSEIDVKKSLNFPLESQDTSGLKSILHGQVTVVRPLVVYRNGSKDYIIDGHHRWSQAYLLNPNCKIACIVFTKIDGQPEDAEDVLRDFQGAIVTSVKSGKVPTSQVESGYNIFQWNDNRLAKHIIPLLNKNKNFVKTWNEVRNSNDDVNAITKTICKNANLMRNKNRPVTNAPSREIMPQTDVDGNAGLKHAMNGMTDI